MEVRDAIYHRRAVRSFTERAVDRSIVQRLLEAAVQAPSAVNGQPWAFAIVQDKAKLASLSDRAKTSVTEARELLASHPELEAMTADPSFNVFYNAGTLIVICSKPVGLHPEWDCYLAGQNLMLAACDLGLGSCPIGLVWPLLSKPDVKRELHIPEDYSAVLPLIVGYPAIRPPATERNPPEILCWQ